MVLRHQVKSERSRVRRGASGIAPRALIVIRLSVILAGGMIALAASNQAQNRPSSQNDAAARHTASANRAVGKTYQRTEAGAVTTASDVDSNSRRSLDYYTHGVRNNLFSAPEPPAKPAPPKPKPTPPPKPAPLPIVPVAPINPFASWSYTGTVRMGDQMMALLENAQTKDGEYVHVGDTFQGAQVLSITDQMVTLTLGGKPSQLAKSDSILVTPLNAAPNQNGPQPGQPGQPGPPQPGGMPPPGQPMNMTPGAPNVVLPNGRVLTGGRAARYQQMLNRQFEAAMPAK